MSTVLLGTKLHIPARSKLVSRPRLMALQEKGLQGVLTLISAPAGSGKTTLVSEWHTTHKKHFPIAWLSLDPADNDPVRFLNYLAASIELAIPNLKLSTFSLLQSTDLPSPDSIVMCLLGELSEQNIELILALDDYHVITNLLVHEVLNDLVTHLPPALGRNLLSRAPAAWRSGPQCAG